MIAMVLPWKLFEQANTIASLAGIPFYQTLDDYYTMRLYFVVTPTSSEFKSRLNSLRSSIHRQHHLIPEHIRHHLLKRTQHITMESTTTYGDPGGLINECFDDFWVEMALVDGRVGG